MKTLRLLLGLAAATLLAAAPARRALTLAGTLTNTTADVAGAARLVVRLEGEAASATFRAEPPLTGSGELAGHFRQGWLELRGELEQGFTLQLRGVFNGRDYRGTYLAAVPGSPVQYGKFQLAVATGAADGAEP